MCIKDIYHIHGCLSFNEYFFMWVILPNESHLPKIEEHQIWATLASRRQTCDIGSAHALAQNLDSRWSNMILHLAGAGNTLASGLGGQHSLQSWVPDVDVALVLVAQYHHLPLHWGASIWCLAMIMAVTACSQMTSSAVFPRNDVYYWVCFSNSPDDSLSYLTTCKTHHFFSPEWNTKGDAVVGDEV